jgi:hypothetical protein
MTDYLAQLDAAEDDQKFNLVRAWIASEPLAFFKVLRQQRPILQTDMATLITRLDDCVEVLNQPKVLPLNCMNQKCPIFNVS